MRSAEKERFADPSRVGAVRATGLLDAPPDDVLQRLVQLIAALLHVPAAQITLVDETRSFSAASIGLETFGVTEREQPADDSFCRLVLSADHEALIADTALDLQVVDCSWVSHGVRAWAGAPVRSADAHVLGTLSVLDSIPRRWSADDARMLTTLARSVSAEMALRVARSREDDARGHAEFQAALLRASHEATLDGVLVVSPEGQILFANKRFQQLWPLPPDVVRDRLDDAAVDIVLDKLVDPEGFMSRVRELYAAPEPIRDELRLKDGRVFDRYGTPLFGADGTYYGYTWYIRDVSAERQATDALEASESRYRSLVSALSNEVWYASPSGELRSDMPSWRAVTGQSPEELLGDGWLKGVHPGDRGRVADAWARALRRREMYQVEYRICAPDGTNVRRLSTRGVPLERGGEIVEWVGVYVDVTDLREAEDAKEHLAALAASAAEGTRALHEVTAALSRAVTLADVLAVILEQGQARLGATGSGVALREGNRVHYEVLRGYSADIKASWSEFGMDEPLPTTYVIRTGSPIFVESRNALIDLFENDRLRSFVETTGEHAWARLPLTTPSGVLGALVFGFDRPRRFSDDERSFAMALAGQCAQAIERARLYERERSTAQVLQRTLLPDALPSLRGAQLSALCQPASNAEVGGDWYDALVLDDGRLAVVVGDVMGKGVRAASVMGQVRNALRGLVHADTSPQAVVTWLDHVVAQLGGDEELVTLVYGVLDPDTGVFEWANAGHMPLLLIQRDSATFIAGEESLPLGLGGMYDTRRLVLEPGEVLLLFSDGLVESRTRPLADGLDQLAAYATGLARDALPSDTHAIRDRLVTMMVDPSDNDDVTVLVLRRTPGAADPVTSFARQAEIVLPARASSAGMGRHFVAQRLGEWHLDHLIDVALVCVSEVITNAVVHANSHAEMSVRVHDGILRFDVRDVGTSGIPTIRPPATPDDTHGRGLLLVEALSDKWGTIGEGDSKVVWFEMSISGGEP